MLLEKQQNGHFLAVQWLGLWTFTAKGPGLILGWGNKIPQATQCSQKRKKWQKDILRLVSLLKNNETHQDGTEKYPSVNASANPCQSWVNPWPMCAQRISHVWLFAILWTLAHQAPLSMGLSRQEYRSRLPFPGDLPYPGIEPTSSASPALASRFCTKQILSHLGSLQPMWESLEEERIVLMVQRQESVLPGRVQSEFHGGSCHL